MKQCGLERGYQYFGWTCCPHLPDRKWTQHMSIQRNTWKRSCVVPFMCRQTIGHEINRRFVRDSDWSTNKISSSIQHAVSELVPIFSFLSAHSLSTQRTWILSLLNGTAHVTSSTAIWCGSWFSSNNVVQSRAKRCATRPCYDRLRHTKFVFAEKCALLEKIVHSVK